MTTTLPLSVTALASSLSAASPDATWTSRTPAAPGRVAADTPSPHPRPSRRGGGGPGRADPLRVDGYAAHLDDDEVDAAFLTAVPAEDPFADPFA